MAAAADHLHKKTDFSKEYNNCILRVRTTLQPRHWYYLLANGAHAHTIFEWILDLDPLSLLDIRPAMHRLLQLGGRFPPTHFSLAVFLLQALPLAAADLHNDSLVKADHYTFMKTVPSAPVPELTVIAALHVFGSICLLEVSAEGGKWADFGPPPTLLEEARFVTAGRKGAGKGRSSKASRDLALRGLSLETIGEDTSYDPGLKQGHQLLFQLSQGSRAYALFGKQLLCFIYKLQQGKDRAAVQSFTALVHLPAGTHVSTPLPLNYSLISKSIEGRLNGALAAIASAFPDTLLCAVGTPLQMPATQVGCDVLREELQELYDRDPPVAIGVRYSRLHECIDSSSCGALPGSDEFVVPALLRIPEPKPHRTAVIWEKMLDKVVVLHRNIHTLFRVNDRFSAVFQEETGELRTQVSHPEWLHIRNEGGQRFVNWLANSLLSPTTPLFQSVIHAYTLARTGHSHGFVMGPPGTGKTYAMLGFSLLALATVLGPEEKILWVSSNNTPLDGAAEAVQNLLEDDSRLGGRVVRYIARRSLNRVYPGDRPKVFKTPFEIERKNVQLLIATSAMASHEINGLLSDNLVLILCDEDQGNCKAFDMVASSFSRLEPLVMSYGDRDQPHGLSGDVVTQKHLEINELCKPRLLSGFIKAVNPAEQLLWLEDLVRKNVHFPHVLETLKHFNIPAHVFPSQDDGLPTSRYELYDRQLVLLALLPLVRNFPMASNRLAMVGQGLRDFLDSIATATTS